MQRSKKMMSLIYLACGFLLWLLVREMMASLWAVLEMGFGVTWLVPIYDVIGVIAGVVFFIVLVVSHKVNDYTDDVLVELSKVSWPNRKETVLSTGIVAVLVGICSMMLFGFDAVWGYLVQIFYQ